MFISYSKALRVDELSSVMFAGCDGRTANAEHQRRQQWHIYVVYGPPHDRHARFVLGGIWKRMAAEIRAHLIHTCKKWSFIAFNTVSLAIPHLFIPGFLRFT
jgi:hypothetical protein